MRRAPRGLRIHARAADFNHLGYNEQTPCSSPSSWRQARVPSRGSAAVPNEMYAIPNRRTTQHVVSLPVVWETPLRTGNLRDPNGPQSTFASESFIDELAAAANTDPVQFRLKMIEASAEDSGFKKARSIACIKAAADAYKWEVRPSPKRVGSGEILSGRGIATPTESDRRRGRSPRSRSTAEPATSGSSASSARTTAGWSSIPEALRRVPRRRVHSSSARFMRNGGSTPRR